VAVSVGGSTPSEVPVFIVGDHPQTGIVSDIDDTVMITALPRPLLAFWNTFGRHEAARRPVPGMADLYRSIAAENPDGIVVYLSTGAWNVAPAIEGFLGRHGFPRGPLLLTDWGPTADAWFRSGKAHKRTALARLIAELPQVSWILVGDDGQHDPELYCEAACAAPGQVRAIAVRELTVAQQLRTHGSAVPPSAKKGQAPVRAPVPEVRGPDGIALVRALRDRGVLAAARLDATVGADDDSSGRASSDVR
jgi:phosphatidate phosphatase APP1